MIFTATPRGSARSIASNNDSGLKRVVFLLDGFTDFEIDGGGSHFIFHGFLNPFVIENSERIAPAPFPH